MKSSESLNRRNHTNPSGDLLRLELQNINNPSSPNAHVFDTEGSNQESNALRTKSEQRDLGSIESGDLRDNRVQILSDRGIVPSEALLMKANSLDDHIIFSGGSG